ncbi:MAG TPA: hypothetical protein PLB90_05705 [Opitutaceae bacterium]|nr:hypothetical protein [Opitutaceae bacterium]
MNAQLYDELHSILRNPECFPVELTLTSGDKITVRHPDEVHVAGRLDRIFFFATGSNAIFEWLPLEFVAKVRANAKKSWWSHFFKGSRE